MRYWIYCKIIWLQQNVFHAELHSHTTCVHYVQHSAIPKTCQVIMMWHKVYSWPKLVFRGTIVNFFAHNMMLNLIRQHTSSRYSSLAAAAGFLFGLRYDVWDFTTKRAQPRFNITTHVYTWCYSAHLVMKSGTQCRIQLCPPLPFVRQLVTEERMSKKIISQLLRNGSKLYWNHN